MFYVIGGITVSVVAFFFTIKFLFELAARVVSFLQNEDRERRGDRTIYDYVRGNYLDPRSCKVSWDWKDPYEVGHSMAFRVHLFYKNGQPFPAHRPVGLRVHISHVELAVDIPVTQEVLQEPSSNVVKVAFTVRRAGRYEISVKLGGLNVAYSPYYKQLVRARFTRSFLAQIIGLRMHYKYFETDDPEFYKSKVCFILNNDMSEMELVFAEEKYNKSGQLDKVVELMTGGAQTPVTNANKIFYLNLLAQYRLASQVKEEVEHFLKGLNELVPENLLAIFDENELELLMCGTGDISVSDFKAHAVVIGGSWHFREKVMRWFWTVVSSLTQEELARLLQFTTGSSQLPPGGFAALCPSFQIIAAPTHSTLPTAHTCFNQLCLPTYDSYEEVHRMLQLAISEGCEGFGMF